jgi:hypothetical protein
MSTARRWRPLSQRHLPPQDDVLVDGVPEYLGVALSRWISKYVGLYWCRMIALELRIAWDFGGDDLDLQLDPERPGREFYEEVAKRNPDQVLDLVDCYLHETMEQGGTQGSAAIARVEETAGALEDLLSRGGSAWRVAGSSDRLERRVDQAVRDDAQKATDAASAAGLPSAAEALQSAWRAAYGRNPDPAEVYRHAVMAVESAAIPVVSPSNTKATLGTMIADMKNKPSKWQFALSDSTGARGIEPVVGLLERLWQGQVRHGSNPTPPVTSPEGEAALHAAATLVHWFASGAVTIT